MDNTLEFRVSKLEKAVVDLENETKSINLILYKLELIESGQREMKNELQKISSKPGERWDKIESVAISVVTGGLVGAVVSLLLRR